jgi:hypothetical protein
MTTNVAYGEMMSKDWFTQNVSLKGIYSIDVKRGNN